MTLILERLGSAAPTPYTRWGLRCLPQIGPIMLTALEPDLRRRRVRLTSTIEGSGRGGTTLSFQPDVLIHVRTFEMAAMRALPGSDISYWAPCRAGCWRLRRHPLLATSSGLGCLADCDYTPIRKRVIWGGLALWAVALPAPRGGAPDI